jgi:hypothetical protein
MIVNFRWRQVTHLLLGAAVAAASLLGFDRPAQACGGFFCNNIPVEQSGEQILFKMDGDDIRAYIRIFYQGDAEDFAWVVPVASQPEVGVGTDIVFNRLDQLTQPNYNLQTDIGTDQCGIWGWGWEEDGLFASGAGETGGEDGGGSSPVTILEQSAVGPYNYTILSATDAGALVAWLNENDYDQPEEATPLIEHYVTQEMFFVALKLQSDKAAGDIAPLILDFEEANPCVPLVLTQIAATPDMPVKVWTLGDERMIPSNWLHVTVNEKKIDWFNYGNNYNDLLTAAVDEGSGHAFTTEYAGSTDFMEGQLYSGQWDTVEETFGAITGAAEFMQELQSYFSGSQKLLGLLQEFMPAPEGIDEQSFYNSPWSYSEEYAALDFDGAAFTAALMDEIVNPTKEVQEMFDSSAYLTRLYTTVSPEEMNRDPIFEFKPDMEDVSNIHTATLYTSCDETGAMGVMIELENGETFVPELPNWMSNGEQIFETTDLSDEPAAATIELLSASAAPRIVRPGDVDWVDAQLGLLPADMVDVPGSPVDKGEATIDLTNAGPNGCSALNSPLGAGVTFLFFLLGLAALRRQARQEN